MGISKYSELRAKTDQQLAAIIDHRLDQGLSAARRLECSTNGSVVALRRDAESAYSEATRLLALVYDLTATQQVAINNKLLELRHTLASAKPKVCTAGA